MGARRVSAALALMALGCGARGKRSTAGYDTTMEFAQAFVEVANAPARAAAFALFPADQVVEDAISCTGGLSPVKELAEARAAALAKLSRGRGLTLTLVGLDEGGDERLRRMRPGDDFGGCKVTREIEVRLLTIAFKVSGGGVSEEKVEQQAVRVVRFGDSGWYLQEL